MELSIKIYKSFEEFKLFLFKCLLSISVDCYLEFRSNWFLFNIFITTCYFDFSNNYPFFALSIPLKTWFFCFFFIFYSCLLLLYSNFFNPSAFFMHPFQPLLSQVQICTINGLSFFIFFFFSIASITPFSAMSLNFWGNFYPLQYHF